jgi:hypothetical protein
MRNPGGESSRLAWKHESDGGVLGGYPLLDSHVVCTSSEINSRTLVSPLFRTHTLMASGEITSLSGLPTQSSQYVS